MARLGHRNDPLKNFAHTNSDATKGAQHWPSGTWPSLAKRYIESDIALHVHVQFWPRENAESRDFCVVFECAISDADLLKSCSGLTWPEVVEACIGDDAYQVNELVPVIVRQFIEDREGIIFGLPVPSLKRLFVLNDCLIFRRDQANILLDGGRELPTDGISEVVSVTKNRPLDVLIHDFVVASHKLAGHIVESASRMVEVLPDKRTTRVRRLSPRERPDDQIAGLRCEVINNTIRLSVEKPFDSTLKCLELTHSTRQLVANRTIRIRHVKTTETN